MADYIYLLDHRLSPAQRAAVRIVRELARSRSLTVFLVGGAVRDLTSGSPVRDLDIVLLGNALKLKKDLLAAGATVIGENEVGQALFLSFPGSVRMELGSTLSVTYPKPGKPVFKPAGIQDDLRRRDFTANAMALSLNEGSYGLLMDPLNGIADIENRELRLVSNYGFIEEPVRMIRATRLMARLGWTLDEKTQQRYDTGKSEDYIAALSPYHAGYELEEVIHEEDPLRVLRRLESEGWMQYLAPYWTSAKVDVTDVQRLRDIETKLQMQGIHPDPSPANFPLLTAKLTPDEVTKLKASFPRQGFVTDVDTLEARTKELAALLTTKSAPLPSQAWKIISSAAPEVVLWLMFSTRSVTLQAKFTSFTNTWPQARQKIPYVLMQEMRIVPELPGYDELVEKLFFELMDDNLQLAEEMKAFLEPFSPPAPPPPVNVRRARTAKKDTKASKARAKKVVVIEEDDDDQSGEDTREERNEAREDDRERPVDDEEDLDTRPYPTDDEISASDEDEDEGEDEDEDEDEETDRPTPPSARTSARKPGAASSKVSKAAIVKQTVKASPATNKPRVIAEGGKLNEALGKAVSALKTTNKRIEPIVVKATVKSPAVPLVAATVLPKKVVAKTVKPAATRSAVKVTLPAKKSSTPAKKSVLASKETGTSGKNTGQSTKRTPQPAPASKSRATVK